MKTHIINAGTGIKRDKLKLKAFSPYLYILPLFVFLVMFLFVPFITAIQKSFYNYDIISVNKFIGLDNYITLFLKDEKFWVSMKNLVVLLVGMLICFQFPIMAAKLTLMLTRDRLQYLYRTLFIVPLAVPLVVVLLMWRFIY